MVVFSGADGTKIEKKSTPALDCAPDCMDVRVWVGGFLGSREHSLRTASHPSSSDHLESLLFLAHYS